MAKKVVISTKNSLGWMSGASPIPGATKSIEITTENGLGWKATVLKSGDGVAPSNSVAPSVSGTPAVGSTLTASVGTWSGDAPIAYAYQWRRNGILVSGQTAMTYVVTTADQGASIVPVITASNAAGGSTVEGAGVNIPSVQMIAAVGLNDPMFPASVSITLPADWADTTSLNRATGDIGMTPAQFFDLVSTARSAPANTYYIGTGGNNTNSGLTTSAKKLSIDSAIAAGNATGLPYMLVPDSIEMARNLGFNGVSPTQDVAVLPAGAGRLNTGLFDSFGTMTIDATYGNCYSLTIGAVDRMCNRLVQNEFGGNRDYTLFATATALNAATLANDGYAYEGGKVYVRRLDGVVPTPTNTRLYRSAVKNFSVTAEVNVYIERLDLEGGQVGAFEYIRSVKSSNKRYVVANNCTFKYGGGNVNVDGRCFSVDGINGMAVLFNCTANHAKTDGFNFHDIQVNGTQYLCIGCIGNDNGRATGASCNGFTGHEDTRGMILGGEARGNRGGTIRGSSDRMHVVGTIIANDLGDIIIGGGTAPTAVLTSGAKYWLDRVKIIMPSGTQAILSSGSGEVHRRDIVVSPGAVQGGSGVLDNY